MHSFPVCWGLDIGHSSIKAVKLLKAGDTVTVSAYAVEPITVPEDGDRDTAVVQALQHLAAREEFGSTPVVAALSGRQVLTRTINVPVINPRNAQRMVELEAKQQIPGGLEDVEWGYHLSPSADGSSNDVALFAVRREVVIHLVDQARAAGLNLAGISVSSLALYNFIRFDQSFPADEAIVILDVGAENTDIVVYQGEGLWMRTLAVSGNDITRAFMKKFKVSFEEAETLKRQAGTSKQADKIIKVIEGSLGELCSEVQRNLGFYKSVNNNAKLENLVISGATFKMPGLPEYFAERLRYTVNILEDLEKTQIGEGLDREHFLQDMQSLGVAMGLALQGLGVAKAGLDLMPKALQIQRILKQKRWAGIALVSVIFVSLVIHHTIINTNHEANEALLKSSQTIIRNNLDKEKISKEILEQVGPKAQELKAYAPFGAQAGATTGITRVIMETVQAIARERKLVEYLPEGSAKGDPEKAVVMPLLVRSVSIPPAQIGELGPFKPFGKARDVTVVIAVPKLSNARETIKLLQERLNTKTVPPYLAAAWGDSEYLKLLTASPPPSEKDLAEKAPKMFSNIQIPTEVQGEETSNYTDPAHTDDKGQIAKLDVARRMPMQIFTLTCTLRSSEEASK